tara:strand:+ start:126 stop:635 length:510 start_codon:yes stop_codon:yes gene_type:complete
MWAIIIILGIGLALAIVRYQWIVGKDNEYRSTIDFVEREKKWIFLFLIIFLVVIRFQCVGWAKEQTLKGEADEIRSNFTRGCISLNEENLMWVKYCQCTEGYLAVNGEFVDDGKIIELRIALDDEIPDDEVNNVRAVNKTLSSSKKPIIQEFLSASKLAGDYCEKEWLD